MDKKLLKLPASAAPGVLLGANTALAIAAGVVAVVGVSALHRRRVAAQSAASSDGTSAQTVRVALLRMHVPQNFRDLVKNDVLLEKSVQLASQTLVIFVLGRDKHEVVNYTSELYTLVWDVACLFDKPLLDVRIVGGFQGDQSQGTSWDELVLQPELNAVLGEDALVDVQALNARRFERDGLFAVTYHPLALHVARRLSNEFHYFENEHTDLTPHDLVLLGGTFDHLHNGHKKLLSLAVSICAKRMIVGVTADSMLVGKKLARLLEPVEKRKRAVEAYVSFLKSSLEVACETITDPFGPAIVVREAAAIVVSTETLAGASKINDIRRERGLPPLRIYACRRTESSSLSSSSIREQIAARERRRQ